MNLVFKCLLSAIPMSFVLSASPAFAKSMLLADLSCHGTTAQGQHVQFQIDGVHNLVRIGGDTLSFKGVETDGKLTEVKAQNHFKIYLSKKYKSFAMKYNGSEKVTGKCSDSMSGQSGQADDTELPDFPEITGD